MNPRSSTRVSQRGRAASSRCRTARAQSCPFPQQQSFAHEGSGRNGTRPRIEGAHTAAMVKEENGRATRRWSVTAPSISAASIPLGQPPYYGGRYPRRRRRAAKRCGKSMQDIRQNTLAMVMLEPMRSGDAKSSSPGLRSRSPISSTMRAAFS